MTLDLLLWNGDEVADQCRASNYGTAEAAIAAKAAGKWAPPATMFGTACCGCDECDLDSAYPTQTGKLAPWVTAGIDASAELWSVRPRSFETTSSLVDADSPCPPGAWRVELALIGSAEGRRYGVTWLAHRFHIRNSCQTSSCSTCAGATVTVQQDCGPVRTISKARVASFMEMPDASGDCVTVVEILIEADDARLYDAPEVLATYVPADWSAAENNPLNPTYFSGTCPADPCDLGGTAWATLTAGSGYCAVTPGEGDDSILTRVIRSPETSAHFDLTRAGLTAPFTSVVLTFVSGGLASAAPDGVTWSVSDAHPAGPVSTAVAVVTDAVGRVCQLQLGLLNMPCDDIRYARPDIAARDTYTLESPRPQGLPAFDASQTLSRETIGRWHETKSQNATAPDLMPPNTPIGSDTTTGRVDAALNGAVYSITRSTSVNYLVTLTNTGENGNDVDQAEAKIWLPMSCRRDTVSITITTYNGATTGTAAVEGYSFIRVPTVVIPPTGTVYVQVEVQHDGTFNDLGPLTAQLYPVNASSTLTNAPSDTATSPPIQPTPTDPTVLVAVSLQPDKSAIGVGATSGTVGNPVWRALIANNSIPVRSGTGGGLEIPIEGAMLVRVHRPSQVASMALDVTYLGTGTPSGPVTDQGLWWEFYCNLPAQSDTVIVAVYDVVHGGSDQDVGPLYIEAFAPPFGSYLSNSSYDSAPGPVVPVRQPISAFVDADLGGIARFVQRGQQTVYNWAQFKFFANGGAGIGDAQIRIPIPQGLSAWSFTVAATGLASWTASGYTAGDPYILLTDVVIGRGIANYITITITKMTHDGTQSDVSPFTATISGGNLDQSQSATLDGPKLQPCPPQAWYESEPAHATVTAVDGKAWWSWDTAGTLTTATATNGTVTIMGGGVKWVATSSDHTAVINLRWDAPGGEHAAVVAVAPAAVAPTTLDCDDRVLPPSPVEQCPAPVEPASRKKVLFTIPAGSIPASPLMTVTAGGVSLEMGIHWWPKPAGASCPPTPERCGVTSTTVELSAGTIWELGPSGSTRTSLLSVPCPRPQRALPVVADCDICVMLTINAATMAPPEKVVVATQEWRT